MIGIGVALIIFCLTGIAFDFRYSGNFRLENYQYTKMVIGCALVGMGFGIPSIVYRQDNIPMPIRILIHMGTGCVIYTIVSSAVGWISKTESVSLGILAAAVQFGAAFIIWFLFMRYYHAEAKRMNERVQELK